MLQKLMLSVLIMLILALPREPINTNVMSRCDAETHNVIVKFISPDLQALKKIGFNLVEGDTVKDTGSCLVYIDELNVYYLTKRETESVRYDGEIWKYVGHECIKRSGN